MHWLSPCRRSTQDAWIRAGRRFLPAPVRDWLWKTVGHAAYFRRWQQDQEIFYHPAYRFVCYLIPKVASTSFSSYLMHLSGRETEAFEAYARLREAVQAQVSFSALRPAERRRILRDPAVFKFTVVRSPWARLASAYLYMFVSRRGEDPCAREVIRAVYSAAGSAPDFRRSVTFEQFVRYVVRTPDTRLDIHWKPQSRFLQGLPVDFIGRLETLDRDFSYLTKRLGLPIDLPRINRQRYAPPADSSVDWPRSLPETLRRRAAYPPHAFFFTPELAEAVRTRYRRDVEDLGYSFEGETAALPPGRGVTGIS